jgi:hypothetical protein
METNTRTSRKHNILLPRTIIFVQTKAGREYAAKDYAPQRWVKSISKTGALTYTTDPRMARRFKTNAAAVAVCDKYAASLTVELKVDELRWTDPADDCGFTYFGYYNGKTKTNIDLFTNQPVQPPAEYTRIMEIMKGGE